MYVCLFHLHQPSLAGAEGIRGAVSRRSNRAELPDSGNVLGHQPASFNVCPVAGCPRVRGWWNKRKTCNAQQNVDARTLYAVVCGRPVCFVTFYSVLIVYWQSVQDAIYCCRNCTKLRGADVTASTWLE